MTDSNRRSSLLSVFLFIVLVLLLGWLGRLLDTSLSAAPGQQPGMLLWLLAPMIASFLLRAVRKEGWSDIGWKPVKRGSGIWYLFGLLLFPFAVLLVLLVGGLFKVVITPGGDGAWDLALKLGALAILPQLVQNIFEESGFRGYLTPKLEGLGWTPLANHLTTGAVWGLWHLPYLAVITPYTNESLLTLVPRFLLGTIALSLVFGELRRRSGTIWPVVVAQTVGGVLLTGLLTSNAIQVLPSGEACVMPTIESFGMILLFVAAGFLLMRKRSD
ncbi:CPBP family intramembrane metalloprotease [bacterium]|nr:CPBP family intramembrane metalloprotease [bacterium]